MNATDNMEGKARHMLSLEQRLIESSPGELVRVTKDELRQLLHQGDQTTAKVWGLDKEGIPTTEEEEIAEYPNQVEQVEDRADKIVEVIRARIKLLEYKAQTLKTVASEAYRDNLCSRIEELDTLLGYISKKK